VYSLDVPNRDVVADYDLARVHRRSPTGEILQSVRGSLLAAYQGYRSDLSAQGPVNPMACTDDERKALRSNYQLLARGRALESLRDDVMAASEVNFRYCPLCGVGRVSTIDHYLPRDVYPEFSILADNLVAVCHFCNWRKGTRCGFTSGDSFFHCYLDDLPDDELVKVHVTLGMSVGVAYQILQPDSVDVRIVDCLRTHFNRFDLWTQYQAVASEAMSEQAESFRSIFEANGAEGLREHIHLQALGATRVMGRNGWRAALLRGLRDSDEFCSGGFELLLPG